MKLTVYTIGPISGIDNWEECADHFKKRSEPLEEMGFRVFAPYLDKEHLRNDLEYRSKGMKGNPIITNHAVTFTDFWRVDMSDILFADFTPAPDRASIGTVAEMSRGFAKGKLIITVLPEKNVHNHAFIREMSTIVFKTVDEALDYFKNFKQLNKN